MASIFDDDEPPSLVSGEEGTTKERSKKRQEPLTPSQLTQGRRTLYGMCERAFQTLEEAMRNADYATAVKAAQILLDRSGFGPKTSLDISVTENDLSELSRSELAERAAKVAGMLRLKAEAEKKTPKSQIM